MTQTRYPSEKQYRFIVDLLSVCDWSSLSVKYRTRLDELAVSVPEFVTAIDQAKWNDYTVAAPSGPLVFEQARALIDTLVPLPRKSGKAKFVVNRATDFPNVFDGKYAVSTETGHLAFYDVSVPGEDSRHFGRIFVDVMASDDKHPVRGAAAKTVLSKIAADPVAAAKRYGVEIGSCGVCGRTLTDEQSRAFGIGPKCRVKLGV